MLQTNVANFGAKIQDLSVGMDDLKEKLRDFQNNANQNKANITRLAVSVSLFSVNKFKI